MPLTKIPNSMLETPATTPTDVGLGNVPNINATARASHTGTQTASTISDFDTQVAVTALLKANNLSGLTNTATARTNIGLGNVDNTSDANKPVSTATQTALNLKANTVHTHPLSDLTQSSATTGQVPSWNGAAWVASTPASSGANTALSNLTTTSINQDLLPSANNTRDIGTNTLRFKDIWAAALKNGSTIWNLATGAFTDTTGQTTLNVHSRTLTEGSFRAMSWSLSGISLLDSANGVSRQLGGVGSIIGYSGLTPTHSVNSFLSTNINTTLTQTIDLSSGRFFNIMYKVNRVSGGLECKTGTIMMAKESEANNNFAAITDSNAATNSTMDLVTFTIDSSGRLLITNGTAYTVICSFLVTQLF